MRSIPSIRNRPCAVAVKAVQKRITVPALPQNRSASSTGSRPRQPVTSATQPVSSTVTGIPRARRASNINRVSSAIKTPVSRLCPSANAAAISARLVMLFEPGGVTTASRGRPTGRQ